MESINVQLLDILEDLKKKDLKKFQWYLTTGVGQFKHIPKSLMQKADTCDTVDKMVESYGLNGAVQITMKILRKMKQNDLAEELRTNTREADTTVRAESKQEGE
ncbi:hypothetical protein MHYP_G00018690 [Metynnis hypsauchen]